MIDVYIQKIPPQIKSELIAVIERVRRNKIEVDSKDLEYLFKIYKTYLVTSYDRPITCRGARSKVCGVFFSMLNKWEQTKTN